MAAMITTISVAFGVHFFNERTYAKDKKVSLLELRIEQKIVQDMIDSDKKELRGLKKEYGSNAENIEFMKEIKKRLLPTK